MFHSLISKFGVFGVIDKALPGGPEEPHIPGADMNRDLAITVSVAVANTLIQELRRRSQVEPLPAQALYLLAYEMIAVGEDVAHWRLEGSAFFDRVESLLTTMDQAHERARSLLRRERSECPDDPSLHVVWGEEPYELVADRAIDAELQAMVRATAGQALLTWLHLTPQLDGRLLRASLITFAVLLIGALGLHEGNRPPYNQWDYQRTRLASYINSYRLCARHAADITGTCS